MFFGSTKEFPSLIFYQLRLKISFSPKIEGAKNIKQAQFGLHRKWRLMEYRRVFPVPPLFILDKGEKVSSPFTCLRILVKVLIAVYTTLVIFSTTTRWLHLKRVRFDFSDLESVKFMAREIIVMRKLDHPNVLKLQGLITASLSSSLYLVFEYMDLVGLASIPGIKFSQPQVLTGLWYNIMFLRWNNCIKYSSCVVHQQRITGGN
ncbi:hypothetical protein Bca101_008196 [Brassica carinata]